jgi:hypothetical protein
LRPSEFSSVKLATETASVEQEVDPGCRFGIGFGIICVGCEAGEIKGTERCEDAA